jgi:lysyl-tRNA synthetase class 2
MADGMQTLSDLAEALLPWGPAERYSYAQLFGEHVGLDPHLAPLEELRAAAGRHSIQVSPQFAQADRDNWLNLLWAERVEPQLAREQSTIVYDYPVSQAALAHVEGDPPVARRFELYARGVELANGFYELLDPAVLRERQARANRQRAAEGKPTLPENSRLLAAMEHGLPVCTGVALGFDRVVMLAAGASAIQEVLAFPIDRA